LCGDLYATDKPSQISTLNDVFLIAGHCLDSPILQGICTIVSFGQACPGILASCRLGGYSGPSRSSGIRK